MGNLISLCVYNNTNAYYKLYILCTLIEIICICWASENTSSFVCALLLLSIVYIANFMILIIIECICQMLFCVRDIIFRPAEYTSVLESLFDVCGMQY